MPSAKSSADSNWPELENNKIKSAEDFELDTCTIQLTNVERELWKGITKADLIMYYNSVAEYILPYIRNRPLSLHIKHRGVNEQGLYIKDMEGRQPDCAEIFNTKRKHSKPGKRSVIDYLVCNNKATLLWVINLGCIDINPWSSTTADPMHPDYIVIDLDPSDDDFKKAVTVAQAAKQFFDRHKLKTFIKTSGKTGMHIFIPCTGFGFGEGNHKGEARIIAENICNEIHELVPNISTLVVSKNSRGSKLYIDPSQNDNADTAASAYSSRPFYIPTVSAPLAWNEIRPSLNPHDFTINTIDNRIKTKGDLWKGLFEKTTQEKNRKILKKFL